MEGIADYLLIGTCIVTAITMFLLIRFAVRFFRKEPTKRVDHMLGSIEAVFESGHRKLIYPFLKVNGREIQYLLRYQRFRNQLHRLKKQYGVK